MSKKLFAACLAVLLLFGMAYADTQVAARQLVLLETETEEVYLFRGESLPSRAAPGMRLVAEDLIATGPDALAFFQADLDKIFQLSSSGSVAISQAETSALVLTLMQGELLFSIFSPVDESEALNIQAGNTTMSIRGTSGRYVHGKGQTTVEIFTGKVSVAVGGDEHTVEEGSRLTLTFDGDGYTALTEALEGPDAAFERFMAYAEQLAPNTGVKAELTPASPPAKSPQTFACPNCGKAGLETENAHKCGICGGWTCGDPSAHGKGVCNAATCLHCGQTGLSSPGAHLCSICREWTCKNNAPHGYGICDVRAYEPTCANCGAPGVTTEAHKCSVCGGFTCANPSQHGLTKCRWACAGCSALISYQDAHKCADCGGFTCDGAAHGIGVCIVKCPSCGETVPTEDAHKCAYEGCGGYTCDAQHRNN